MLSIIQCDGNGILHGNNEGVSYVEGGRKKLIPQGTGRNIHILYSGRIQDLVFLILILFQCITRTYQYKIRTSGNLFFDQKSG